MARGTTYRLALKRRREGKTDYRRRTRYLVSGIPRLVARRSNAHYFAHVVVPSEKGDITVVSAHSKELARDFGWQGHGASASTGYLTGYLVGKRAVKGGVERAILDAGLVIPGAGSNIFALVKGAVDGGLKVPCDEGCYPKMGRIRGEEVAKAFAEDQSIARHRKKGLDLASLPRLMDEVLGKISSSVSEA